MKMKKILALSLAAAMALSLGACGDKADSEGGSGSSTTSESGSTGGSAEGGTLKIGGIGPVTGDQRCIRPGSTARRGDRGRRDQRCRRH